MLLLCVNVQKGFDVLCTRLVLCRVHVRACLIVEAKMYLIYCTCVLDILCKRDMRERERERERERDSIYARLGCLDVVEFRGGEVYVGTTIWLGLNHIQSASTL